MVTKLLSVKEVEVRTGWSGSKIRKLIRGNKLRAINSSTGLKPVWEIPEEALLDFLGLLTSHRGIA